ncbi:hypothetical protein AB0N81_38910 [Streptomyces sp. NPDC093510]|uniref:hypothetical protein n=1 Tax=Streptomyces sp. NPDC093510 TaxID=3155199 RepID=UPI003417D310
MGLTPAEAALSGTALGAAATFSSAWLIQLATTRRDREHRVWEQRVAAYVEAMALVRRSGDLRETAVRTGELRGSRDGAAAPADDMPALIARLEIFGTDVALDVCRDAFEATDAWQWAWGSWRTQEGNNPRRSTNDRLWVEFENSAATSREADLRVLELLRAEVRGEQLGRRRSRGTRGTQGTRSG